jgi:hypothetical protein
MIGGYTAAYGTGCGVGNTGRWLGWLQDGMLRQGSFARLNLSLQPEQRLELCVIIATLLMNSAITTTVELSYSTRLSVAITPHRTQNGRSHENPWTVTSLRVTSATHGSYHRDEPFGCFLLALHTLNVRSAINSEIKRK